MSRFAKLAWFTLAWNVADVLWGALVRATGSGAGCGNHWPTCNGDVIPTPQNIATVIEFTHRILSGVAIVLIGVLLVWGWRKYAKGSPVRLGVTAAAVFILLEAALGAGLVLLDLVTTNTSAARAIAVAAHLLNTFFLLASLALTAWWASGGTRVSLKKQGRLPLLFGLGLAGVALLAMAGAVTALGDTLFPAQNLAQGLAQDADINSSFLVRLRVIHPLIAVLVSVYTLGLVRYLAGRLRDAAGRRLLLALGGLVVVQLAAGAVNVLLLAPTWMQLLHLLLADGVWVTYVLLSAAVLGRKNQISGRRDGVVFPLG